MKRFRYIAKAVGAVAVLVSGVFWIQLGPEPALYILAGGAVAVLLSRF